MIYFDNSATTKMSPEVLDAFVKTNQKIFANPSSLHSQGEVAYRMLSQSRKQVAELLEVDEDEIYFTSGGTESNNWVLKGTAMEKRQFGKHLIVSAIEHPSVIESAKQLATLGFDVDFAPVDESGELKIEEFQKLLRKDTILVSIMAVNNEMGRVQPIQAISDILAQFPTIHFHVDAVQAVGKVPTDRWLTNRVDFASLSAHKFHGPKGVGILFWRKDRRISPLLTGGGQEKGLRSGTENVGGIVSSAKALRLTMTGMDQHIKQIQSVRDYLASSLAAYEHVVLFTDVAREVAPHILTFGIKGVKGEVLVRSLQEHDIFVSTTSACSSKKKMDGGTLLNMGVPRTLAETAVRISLDEQTQMMEAEQFLTVFNQLYQKFSKISG